ncbi:MAG: MotA/TolQ/ExbB proton channel family protein [Oscillospiraceae bacterium]|nr:MotA/TolQ/ExbB proton channel family protein [Oscillospiraceae bacterium]
MLKNLHNMPVAGFVVIIVIAILFVLSVVLLFHTYLRYRVLAGKAKGSGEESRGFKAVVYEEYRAAYKQYGQDTNTPAIITDTISSRLSGLLLCERYLNNAVSLFVTLGLFGTFLGLSLSVASLTELISYSNSTEWLSVLDSVGGGLMSALSGMGVAFYTSLVGAGCSIMLTILRTIFNPQTQREKLETKLELWLDTEVAPTLYTEASKDNADLVKRMIAAMDAAVGEFKATMNTAASAYIDATNGSAAALGRAMDSGKSMVGAFDKTVNKFNDGVHDFSEVDYNLRGSVERMDLAVRDLATAMREINRRMEGAHK